MKITELPNERRFSVEVTVSELQVIVAGLESLELNDAYAVKGHIRPDLASIHGQLLVTFAQLNIKPKKNY